MQLTLDGELVPKQEATAKKSKFFSQLRRSSTSYLHLHEKTEL